MLNLNFLGNFGYPVKGMRC